MYPKEANRRKRKRREKEDREEEEGKKMQKTQPKGKGERRRSNRKKGMGTKIWTTVIATWVWKTTEIMINKRSRKTGKMRAVRIR